MKRTGWGAALLLTLMLGVAPAEAATTYTVSGTSDPPGATCTGTACASLRAAVTNLPSGATIQLSSGIYKLNGVLQIGQTETIVGLSPAQTTIQQTKSGDGVIEASAGDLSLSQLTITGGTKLGHSGFDQHAGGIFQAGSSLTLDHVSVTGNKATGSTLSGTNGGDAVGGIQIDGSATTLTISGSSITNNTATGGTGADAVGSGSGRGGGTAYGAIADFAAAPTITNSVISQNTSTGGRGGQGNGLSGFSGGMSGQSDGAITVIGKPVTSTTLIMGSTIANNKSSGGQGGAGVNTAKGGAGNTTFGAITGSNNTIKIVSSTISGNTSAPATGGPGSPSGSGGSVLGGGISVDTGSLVLINSTVAGNVISGQNGQGGGIDKIGSGTLTLGSDTIFGNTSPAGGNLYVSSSQLTLAGSIIAGGVQTVTGGGPSGNCHLDSVTETDLGHNLESTTPSQCGLSVTPPRTDLVGSNPQLASLASYGGTTQTMALGVRSPAQGAAGACTDISLAGSVALTADQRGQPRPVACDIGAFQHQPVAEVSPPSITGTPTFGSTLTCHPGQWTGDGVALTYLWRLGQGAVFAAGPTLVLSSREFGTAALNCQVTAAGTYGPTTPGVATLQMPTNCNCTPKITKVGQSHRRWRRGGRLARLSAAAKRPPVGTTFTFTLDRAATVRLSFTRTSNGRVVRHRCVSLTRANRRGRACTLTKAAGSMTFKAHAGANKITFQGRLSKQKRLATGAYLLGITAAVTGGPSSRPSTLRFSVVS